MTRPVTAFNVSIDACWTSINSSKPSQPAKKRKDWPSLKGLLSGGVGNCGAAFEYAAQNAIVSFVFTTPPSNLLNHITGKEGPTIQDDTLNATKYRRNERGLAYRVPGGTQQKTCFISAPVYPV
jgi:hypothetical protein